MANSLPNESSLYASDCLRLHWPEYLMEAAEAGLYLFSVCTSATSLWHPKSPIHGYFAEPGSAPDVDGLSDKRDHYGNRPFALE